jgi:hypothetical protein
MTPRKILFAAAALLALAAPVSAAELIESYQARLSSADHFNSSGERLTATAAIIRQDRANFHKFGIRDAEDESDRFFADQGNRALMERLLERGRTTGEARRAIVNGTPLIRVELWRDRGDDFVTVTVY